MEPRVLIIQFSPLCGIHPIHSSLFETFERGGVGVDLVFQSYDGFRQILPDHPLINLVPVDVFSGKNIIQTLGRCILIIPLFIKLLYFNRYKSIFVIEPLALIFSSLMLVGRLQRVKYLSLEILVLQELKLPVWRLYRRLERIFIRRVGVVITQDYWRKELLLEENKPIRGDLIVLPNADFSVEKKVKGDFFHKLFKLPVNAKIILHPGSPMMASRIISAICDSNANLPDNYFLVFHFSQSAEIAVPKGSLSDRILISQKPVASHEIDLLYASADIGLAFYECFDAPVGGKNIEVMGHSSGKFNMFLKHEVPVVVSSQETFKEIFQKEKCGVAIDDFAQLISAVNSISADYERFSMGASAYFHSYLAFELYSSRLLEIAGGDSQ